MGREDPGGGDVGFGASCFGSAWVAFATVILLLGSPGETRAGDPEPPAPARRSVDPLVAGPLVGFDGPHAVRIWLVSRRAEDRLAVELAPVRAAATTTPGQAATSSPRVVAVPPGERVPGRRHASRRLLRVTGLAASTWYRYRVRVGPDRRVVASGRFRTGPEPGRRGRVRLAVVSCMDVKRHPRQVAWRRLLRERPDLLLHLGDNVYANTTDPKKAWRVFLRQRRVPEYRDALRRVSTLAIWDDHDYGQNDGDGTMPGKRRSLATFRELWPNPAAGTAGTPGVFFRVALGDVDLFCLDTRYHRSPDLAPDDDRKTMLGPGQWAWLEKGLRSSKATFKLVASGSTYVANFKDYWGLYPRELRRLARLTRTVPGMVLVSGDMHVSAMRLVPARHGARYPLFEVISSGIAVNRDGNHYFSVLDLDTAAEDPTITVRWQRVDETGRTAERWSHTIRRSELTPPEQTQPTPPTPSLR